jgi:hypothetical protein
VKVSRTAFFAFQLVLCCIPAYACECPKFRNAKTAMRHASVVFLGTVVSSELLPQHSLMGGRSRHAVTFQVTEYWKRRTEKTVTLYDVDLGSDCDGAGFGVGPEFLVYAALSVASDYRLRDSFRFGWTDILPAGTPMLKPIGCMPGGKTSFPSVRRALRQLGRGRAPAKD